MTFFYGEAVFATFDSPVVRTAEAATCSELILSSHLFNQALVAGQMWLDQSFREQLRLKMQEDGYRGAVPEPYHASDYEIVIAIINRFTEVRPKIPFFSKVAMCFAATNIRNLGYSLTLKNIPVVNR